MTICMAIFDCSPRYVGKEDTKISSKKSLDEDVQGIGRVLGEHHVFRRVCSQEAGESLTCSRDIIRTPATGGPSRPEDRQGKGLRDGCQHLRRFWPARCRIIQIDDWLILNHETRFSADLIPITKKKSNHTPSFRIEDLAKGFEENPGRLPDRMLRQRPDPGLTILPSFPAAPVIHLIYP